MKHTVLATGLAFALLAGISSIPAAAQAPAPATAAQSQLESGQVLATRLMDRDIYSSDDVEIGEIEDLVLDAQGKAVVAVIEVEGRLGFTDKYVAIPYAQITPSATDRKRATVPMTRDQIKALAGFRYQD
jgi:sporulation protein YlmC with PRC-barrel domain